MTDYPDDLECPDWCVGSSPDEPNLGAHYTGAVTIDGLTDRQAFQAFGVRGWYEGDPDYVEITVRGVDGRKTVLQLEPDEWRVVSDTVDQLIYTIT